MMGSLVKPRALPGAGDDRRSPPNPSSEAEGLNWISFEGIELGEAR